MDIAEEKPTAHTLNSDLDRMDRKFKDKSKKKIRRKKPKHDGGIQTGQGDRRKPRGQRTLGILDNRREK
jgi:hypothetical protein